MTQRISCGEITRENYLKSVILIDDKENLLSFGDEAERQYAQLVKNKEEGKYFYFKHFRRTLYQKDFVDSTSSVLDVSGKKLKVLQVFTLAIRYIKQCIEQQHNVQPNDNINYILTIPTDLEESAVQLYKDAAYNAGLKRMQLRLELEPIAAMMYGLQLQERMNTPDLHSIRMTTKCIIVNLEDEAADLSAYEIYFESLFEKLMTSVKWQWGSRMAYRNVVKLLKSLFGKEAVEKSLSSLPDFDYNHLVYMFKDKAFHSFPFFARKIKGIKEHAYRMVLPDTLLYIVKQKKMELMDQVTQSDFAGKVSFCDDELCISYEIYQGFFNNIIKDLNKNIEEILKSVPGIDTILMVGSFSALEIIQKEIRRKFRGANIEIVYKDNCIFAKGGILCGNTQHYCSKRSECLNIITLGQKQKSKYN